MTFATLCDPKLFILTTPAVIGVTEAGLKRGSDISFRSGAGWVSSYLHAYKTGLHKCSMLSTSHSNEIQVPMCYVCERETVKITYLFNYIVLL